MNRLILIGNGFDLAHNLKTSYHHLIIYYLDKVVSELMRTGKFTSPLLKVTTKYGWYRIHEIASGCSNSLEVFRKLRPNNLLTVEMCDLLELTFNSIEQKKWVDLEQLYFSLLVRYSNSSNRKLALIQDLNKQWEELKLNLEEYLISVTEPNTCKTKSELLEQLYEPVKNPYSEMSGWYGKMPNKILFLNFNYTKTLSPYINKLKKEINPRLIHIHGSINDQNNPIVFGFGDEHSDEYLSLLKAGENHAYLKYVKSFYYVLNDSYQSLIEYIDGEAYEVYVMGHSLGLSDRTMLREIFEHENCKSIKLFYHENNDGVDDFLPKAYNLAAHFTNQASMRKKIVPKSLSNRLCEVGKK